MGTLGERGGKGGAGVENGGAIKRWLGRVGGFGKRKDAEIGVREKMERL